MSDQNLFKDYYEKHWASNAAFISQREEERIKETLALIPHDVESILDAGCGDGRITNRLFSKYNRVIGLDNSQEALRHVKTESILSSIDNIPFPDKYFDLVICSESLEHLPFCVYPLAITEIQRVATKYVIITVPNSEDRKRQFVTCPYCGCVFHTWRHLRSYTPRSMTDLFSQFNLQTLEVCLAAKMTPTFLVKIARKAGIIPHSSIPYTALCPQCGYSQTPKENLLESKKDIPSIHFLRLAASRLIPGKKRGGWLLALYQRR